MMEVERETVCWRKDIECMEVEYSSRKGRTIIILLFYHSDILFDFVFAPPSSQLLTTSYTLLFYRSRCGLYIINSLGGCSPLSW